MASKRMFSKAVVDSDAFLDMPMSAQALYFHLGMNADDDGFVGNPRRIQRVIGCNDDDIKVLISKKFLLTFESGVVVIKHHRMNNNWDKYNCKRTVYTDELEQLNIKENKAYTLDKSQGVCIQSGNSLETVFRIEENRIDKKRIDNSSSSNDDAFPEFWSNYPKKVGKGAAEKSWKKHKPDLAVVLEALEKQKNSDQWVRDGGQFIPHPATWLNQKRWEDEVEVNQNINLDA